MFITGILHYNVFSHSFHAVFLSMLFAQVNHDVVIPQKECFPETFLNKKR